MADSCRAVDPHSFFADPDPAILLNAHPDPAVTKCGLGSSLTKFVTDYFMKCGNRQQKNCSNVIINRVCLHLVNTGVLK